MPKNIPAISDTPFAVGSSVLHRNDFGNAERVCMFLAGDSCLADATTEYSQCPMRCWGADQPEKPTPTSNGWTYDGSAGQPQGRVFTLAGGGTTASHGLGASPSSPLAAFPVAVGRGLPGFVDGDPATARFRRPQAVAVANDFAVFVADTGNHAVRRIDPVTLRVDTVAGGGPSLDGTPGWADGAGSDALFSSPSGIAVWHDCATMPATSDRPHCGVVVVIADTFNHRIRELRGADTLPGGSGFGGSSLVAVRTLAGGGALLPPNSEAQGLRDGLASEARFDTPHGVIADPDGHIFVADTLNYAVRHISPAGEVRTLAGTVVRSPLEGPGCPAPCLTGVQGFADGNRTAAQFFHPYDLALGEGSTLLVSDADRLRRITRAGSHGAAATSTLQGVTSFDRVVTVAGGLEDGDRDGIGQRARLDKPRGVAATGDGRVYVADSSGCRLRMVTPADRVALPLACSSRPVDIWRPRGCSSYDQPGTALDRAASDTSGAVRHNRDNPDVDGRGFPVSCIGSAPPDIGLTSSRVTAGPNAGTAPMALDVQEDVSDGSAIRVLCPSACSAALAAPATLRGGEADAASGAPGPGTAALPSSAGLSFYSETSPVCLAAAHAGVIDLAAGGLATVVLRRGWGASSFAGVGAPGFGRGAIPASTRNGVFAAQLDAAPRTFTVEPFNLSLVKVQTVAGSANAPLDDPCGYEDAQPPQAARFAGPAGIAVRPSAYSLNSTTETLVIADADNHAVRALTASCSVPCENGGFCAGPELCSCPTGWAGSDCTTPVCSASCAARQLCTAPDTCTCKPGYSGLPGCSTPLCAQVCVNGQCSAPDTCTCASGWFDANCTTPVCSQTCGNGGNCTGPDTCSCPKEWTGLDCRTPVCDQTCLNGASCVAPNTCMCEPGWSGHDCSKPVCSQGMFRPDPLPQHSAPSAWRLPFWDQYTPCDLREWCNATGEFDCLQLQKGFVHLPVQPVRNLTGRGASPAPSECMLLELAVSALAPFRYETEFDNATGYWRRAPQRPYGWGPTNASHAWSAPSAAAPDRQVALAHFQRVTQGVYVCANGGNCTAPELCQCAPGWTGFDCRTPVCDVGYFFRDRLRTDYWTAGQGSYSCSERAVTVWENPRTDWKFRGYVHEHPNYFSRHMDGAIGWVPVHQQKPPLGDNTNEGWRRDGWWERVPGTVWLPEANCTTLFDRSCPAARDKERDLSTGALRETTANTTQAYRPRIEYNDRQVLSDGRWLEPGGECVDRVLLGCFNGGTCVAPNTCVCAPGWEGHDCSLPVCSQTVADVSGAVDVFLPDTVVRADAVNLGEADPLAFPPKQGDVVVQLRQCPNRGNCTHPDTCTCEKGWGGADCTVPLCAQECFNGGTCTAPDTCTCVQFPNSIRDLRGEPYFRRSDGDPQLTGWTGYDCNTPICVQAERWVRNDEEGTERFVATVNDGITFQGGCNPPTRFTPANRSRVSVELCGKERWYDGDWANSWDSALGTSFRAAGREVRVNHPNFVQIDSSTWAEGDKIEGEGIYACFNGGSCVAPDVCECEAGRWEGFDCNIPICAYTDLYGLVRGCTNGGVCAAPDQCDCSLEPSLLPLAHASLIPAQTETGWMGDDCSIPICVQGFFDPDCRDIPPATSAGIAAMGQGCWRCANGGNCTSPDICTCPPEWTGYDCRTPVCTQHATQEFIADLDTVDPAKITAFELDPCGTNEVETWNGMQVGRGNCSAPNTCTCLCKSRSWLDAAGNLVEEPWTDIFLRAIPAGFVYGTSDCLDGYQGALNPDGSFRTCHLTIYVPTWLERNTLLILVVAAASIFFLTVVYVFVRRRLRQRFLAIKAERRRSRRSSSEAGSRATKTAFAS